MKEITINEKLLPHKILDEDEKSIKKIIAINIFFLIIFLFTIKNHITLTTIITLLITTYIIWRIK